MPTGGAGLIAGITDLLAGGAGGLGAAAGGAAGAAELGADVGLAAGGAGLADALGSGAGLGAADLGLGVGGAAGPTAASLGTAVGPAASSLGGGLGGLAGPAGLSGGIVPAGAPPIDLASAAAVPQGDVTALYTGDVIPLNGTPISPITGSPSVAAGGTMGIDFSGAGFPATAMSTTGTDLGALAGGSPGAGLTTAGTGAAVPGAAAGAAPAGSGTFLDNLLGGATNALTKNPLGIGLAAGGLGYNILEGRKLSTNEQALQAAAGTEAGAGQQLQNYINTGQLPPGMAAQVANATAAAKASIISGYASRGQNADPAQNSALAQELAQVDMNALALQGKMATDLLNAGLTETGMSNNLYAQLIGMDQAQAKLTGQAIANFASALAGGPRTIQIGNQGVTT